MGGLTQATNHCSCNCCESRYSLLCHSVKSRHFKLGHLREVNRRKEVDRLSCESEGQVARDINWESGRRDFKIFWRRAETLACASRLAGPGHASHQQCQPEWHCQPFSHQLNAQLFLANLLTHSDGMQPILQTSTILNDIVLGSSSNIIAITNYHLPVVILQLLLVVSFQWLTSGIWHAPEAQKWCRNLSATASIFDGHMSKATFRLKLCFWSGGPWSGMENVPKTTAGDW